MNKEYIEHEKAFHKNLEDFKQGVLDYFFKTHINLLSKFLFITANPP